MRLIQRYRSIILSLTGKRRIYAALLLGICATLALPPIFIFPALIPAFTGLLLLIESSQSRKEAAKIGWWFGLGHFTSGLYWITIALLTDAAQFGWLVPFAVLAISAVLAIYIAIASAITYSFRPSIWIFAVSWLGMEYLRSILLSGFPWNLIGYSWAFSDSVSQIASVTGIWGLSLVTLLFALSPLLWGDGRWQKGLAITALCLPLVLGIGGAVRLHYSPLKTVPNVTLRLVQGNIAQHHKWIPELRLKNLIHYVTLSTSPGFENVTHILWPETALPYFLEEDREIWPLVKSAIPENGILITGALRKSQEPGKSMELWNSLFVLNNDMHIEAHYNKFHLVPFGEYVPFRSLLPMTKITAGSIDFSAGTGPETLSVSKTPPFSPLICYEGIFPGHVTNETTTPPDWILNITNDAWFGASTGPYQHFYMVKMRAIEEGLPLVRVANTGISAVIDSYGRIVAKLGLGETGIVDAPLPQNATVHSIYGAYGNYVVLLMILFISTLIIIIRKIRSF